MPNPRFQWLGIGLGPLSPSGPSARPAGIGAHSGNPDARFAPSFSQGPCDACGPTGVSRLLAFTFLSVLAHALLLTVPPPSMPRPDGEQRLVVEIQRMPQRAEEPNPATGLGRPVTPASATASARGPDLSIPASSASTDSAQPGSAERRIPLEPRSVRKDAAQRESHIPTAERPRAWDPTSAEPDAPAGSSAADTDTADGPSAGELIEQAQHVAPEIARALESNALLEPSEIFDPRFRNKLEHARREQIRQRELERARRRQPTVRVTAVRSDSLDLRANGQCWRIPVKRGYDPFDVRIAMRNANCP